MALGNGECKRDHIEWVEAEQESPAEIGARVLVYPIGGEIESAEYAGEGEYRVWDYAIMGEDITHWAYCPKPR